MTTTQTLPSEATTGTGHHVRRFSRALLAAIALLVVVVATVVTLALRHDSASAPPAPPPRVAPTWNTPLCPLHGIC